MSNARRLAEIVTDAMGRFPWCARVKGCVELTPDSIRVDWINLEGMERSFDLGYGEIQSKPTWSPNRIARAFAKLLAKKCQVVVQAQKLGKAENDEVLDRLKGQGGVITQHVMACVRCDRIMPDSAKSGTPCSCGGVIERFAVDQPKMPVPGLSGRKHQLTGVSHDIERPGINNPPAGGESSL